MQAELAAAGYASITAEDVIQSTRSRSPREAAISQCHGGLVRAAIDEVDVHYLAGVSDGVAVAPEAGVGSKLALSAHSTP